MSGDRIVFVDRDGTLIEEPPDEQVDRLDKMRLMPGVIPALLDLRARRTSAFVMVTNQDGLGTPSLPHEDFELAHRFMLDLFASQGIEFDAVFICPHFKRENCGCRKPKLGMVDEYLRTHPLDRARSYMIGDRDTDLEFARNLGIQRTARSPERPAPRRPGRRIAARIAGAARRAQVRAQNAGDRDRASTSICRARGRAASPRASDSSITCSSRSPSTAALHCTRLRGRPAHRRAPHRRGLRPRARRRRCARRWATSTASRRYGFLLAMDEAEAQVALDLSGRPYFVWEGRFDRERVGEMPTELVPHFFRSLARDPRSRAAPARARREYAPHDRVVLQGRGPSLRQAIRREGGELPSTKGVL